MPQIEISWAGKSYKIKEEQAFQVGELVEDIVTLPELADMGLKNKPKSFVIARAYSAIINFAGGSATPEEVRKVMMTEMASGNADTGSEVITALMEILLQGAPRTDTGESEPASKE